MVILGEIYRLSNLGDDNVQDEAVGVCCGEMNAEKGMSDNNNSF